MQVLWSNLFQAVGKYHVGDLPLINQHLPRAQEKMMNSGMFVPHQTGWRLALWVRHFGFLFTPITKMNHLFNKKRKKSPEPPPQGGYPGFPPNIAAPVRHQSGPNIGPKGGESRSYQGLK